MKKQQMMLVQMLEVLQQALKHKRECNPSPRVPRARSDNRPLSCCCVVSCFGIPLRSSCLQQGMKTLCPQTDLLIAQYLCQPGLQLV